MICVRTIHDISNVAVKHCGTASVGNALQFSISWIAGVVCDRAENDMSKIVVQLIHYHQLPYRNQLTSLHVQHEKPRGQTVFQMHKVPGVDFGFCFQYIDHPTGAVSIQYIINYKFPCHADTEASVIDNKTQRITYWDNTQSQPTNPGLGHTLLSNIHLYLFRLNYPEILYVFFILVYKQLSFC